MLPSKLWVFVVSSSLLVGATALAEADKKTDRLWKAKCASCHGREGKGDTEKGVQMKIVDMTTAEFQAKKDDELKKQILEGVKTEKDGVKKEMDPFKADLKPDQIDALLALIRSFKK